MKDEHGDGLLPGAPDDPAQSQQIASTTIMIVKHWPTLGAETYIKDSGRKLLPRLDKF
jgi:hypothetical protein